MELQEAQQYRLVPWTDDYIVREDFHVIVYKDKYPVTEGHLLFVPRYDTDTLVMECLKDAYEEGVRQVKEGLCDGFNIGMNRGQASGQTVMYPHVHLIPRRNGDCENPRGGIRHVIPGKGDYKVAG